MSNCAPCNSVLAIEPVPESASAVSSNMQALMFELAHLDSEHAGVATPEPIEAIDDHSDFYYHSDL